MPITKKSMRNVRVKARIASKVREKDLLGKAKMLMEDYELVLPECPAECGRCHLKKTRARLEKITRYKDDPDKLAKFAKRGDRLGRAYAATIGLVHEEAAPYLASAKYPAGTIMYALRGRTDKEKLIAVQNFDSPKWRVLGVLQLVKKKGLHFYSWGDNFVCTGRTAAPPEEYVRSAAEAVGATKLDGDTYSCPHGPSKDDHIEFDWVSAGKKILLCDSCANKAGNTLSKLSEGMAVPHALDEFDIKISRALDVCAGDAACARAFDLPVDEALLDKYASGEFGDKELIEKHMGEAREKVESGKNRIYIRGDRCFGDDASAFVRDITEDDVEAKALVAVLAAVDHAVVATADDTVNRILSRFWSGHGTDALKALVPEETATKHYKDDEESRKSPLKVIRQAMKDAGKEEATSRIPAYKGLGVHARFTDEIARAYKTGGVRAATAVLDGSNAGDHTSRAIAHAFYLSLGISTKSWKFTDEEKQFGAHLQGGAKALLESEGKDAHHEAFVKFMKAAGSTEDIRRA